jgi:hypothetical protein
MKLVAMRRQDAADIVALAQQLGLGTDPAAYVELLARVYSGDGALQQVLSVPEDSVPTEALHRGRVAANLVRQAEG